MVDQVAEFEALSRSDKKFLENLADQRWRLENLYTIVDKQGKVIPFKPNWAQIRVYDELTPRHLIPKGRQFGISTALAILQLDCCLFIDNFSALTICHNLEDAEKLFWRNIKGVYDRLPDWLKEMVGATRDRARDIRFSNGSYISVATSGRSGAYNLIHISEFGKICAKYPDKAREIVTGTFEAAGKDQIVAIESTAEGGAYGYFYDYCMDAKRAQDESRHLTEMDWRMTFLPWWKHPEYVSNPMNVVLMEELVEYFEKLEAEQGIKLSPARKAWYQGKFKTLGEDMKQEYPSYLEEAFEVAIKGAYYEKEMTKARQEGRICSVPHQQGVKVDTWWDLGMDDAMAIWFTQEVGREVHLINYEEFSGETMSFYARLLKDLADERGYVYGSHVAPHDIEVRELGGGSRWESAARLGLTFTVAPKLDPVDGIEAVRNDMSRWWIDSKNCEFGIRCLDAYQKEWDDRRGTYKTTPLHNWACHAADAVRTGVTGRVRTYRPRAQEVERRSGWGA